MSQSGRDLQERITSAAARQADAKADDAVDDIDRYLKAKFCENSHEHSAFLQCDFREVLSGLYHTECAHDLTERLLKAADEGRL